MTDRQRSTTRWMWWLRWSAAAVAGTIMFMTGNAFLYEKLKLWQVETLHLWDRPPDVSRQDWFLQCEHTHRFYIVFGDSELLRDDNPEGRDTRADIERWGNVIDAARILLPLACGVTVFALVYTAVGFVVPHRK